MKPGEFFIGVLDFFAILLPGAIAVALFLQFPSSGMIVGMIPGRSENDVKIFAFLMGSYFAGHLIFLCGSCIDYFYNKLRHRMNPYGNHSAYKCATRIRNSMVPESELEALNTFQWSRSVLLSICPAAAADVHRLEADSKFFRSLLVVCILAAMAFASNHQLAYGTVALVLVVPCFARYYERRLKSTTQAYIHLVTLYRLGKLQSPFATDVDTESFPDTLT